MYLVEHGTSSLKEGEAFMFSEDTGEASLFLASGEVIRRIVAQPRDAKELVAVRRPDMLVSNDVLYNLSLLGKLMPKSAAAQQPPEQAVSMSSSEAPLAKSLSEPDFKADNLMGDSQNFWSWLKGLFKF